MPGVAFGAVAAQGGGVVLPSSIPNGAIVKNDNGVLAAAVAGTDYLAALVAGGNNRVVVTNAAGAPTTSAHLTWDDATTTLTAGSAAGGALTGKFKAGDDTSAYGFRNGGATGMGLSGTSTLVLRGSGADSVYINGNGLGVGAAPQAGKRIHAEVSGAAAIYEFMASGSGGFATMRVGSTTETETAQIAGGANDATGTLMGVNKANATFFYGGSSHTSVVLGGTHASSTVIIAPGNAEKVRITSDGLVGIGKAPAANTPIDATHAFTCTYIFASSNTAASSTVRAEVTGGGKLGIRGFGLTAAGATLGANNNLGNTVLESTNQQAGAILGITTLGAIDIVFGTLAIERFRIDHANLALKFSEGFNLSTGTVTGTKLGATALQKLALWGAAPVVQPTAVADAADGAVNDVEARAALNALLARARTVGLIAAA